MTQIHPIWEKNKERLANCIKEYGGNFLRSPEILQTMFCHDFNLMEKEIDVLQHGLLASNFELVEPPQTFGNPTLIEGLDPNTIHHLFHIDQYAKYFDIEKIKKADHIIEFGGGYGNFCRLVKLINPNCDYTIIDLPEMSYLQAYYLANTMTEDVFESISFKQLGDVDKNEACDLFVATWSLSECPVELQKQVFDTKLFKAKSILASYHQCGDHIPFMKESTFFQEEMKKLDATIVPNTVIPGINNYAFR